MSGRVLSQEAAPDLQNTNKGNFGNNYSPYVLFYRFWEIIICLFPTISQAENGKNEISQTGKVKIKISSLRFQQT